MAGGSKVSGPAPDAEGLLKRHVAEFLELERRLYKYTTGEGFSRDDEVELHNTAFKKWKRF